MNKALPTPQPPRNQTIPDTPDDIPARALKATIKERPTTSVFFAPMREDTHPVISIATAVTRK